MADRTFIGFDANGNKIKIRLTHDREWNEFVAKVWVNGSRYDAADYFTDDRLDAIETCKAMVSGG